MKNFVMKDSAEEKLIGAAKTRPKQEKPKSTYARLKELQLQIVELKKQAGEVQSRITALNAPQKPFKPYSWDWGYFPAVFKAVGKWDGKSLLTAHDKIIKPGGPFSNFVSKNRHAIATDLMPKEMTQMQGWIGTLSEHVASYAANNGYETIVTRNEYSRRNEASFEKLMHEYEQSPLVKAEQELKVELGALNTLIADLATKKAEISSAARRAAKEKKEDERKAKEHALRRALDSGAIEPTPQALGQSGLLFTFSAMLVSHCKHDTRHEYYQYSKWASSRGYRAVGGLIHTFKLVDIKDEFGNSWPDMQFSESRHWYELLGDHQEVKFQGKIVDGKLEFLRPDEASADIVGESGSK